jgi:hypothetical protein
MTLAQTCDQQPQVRQMMEVRQLIHQERELCAKVNTLYDQLTDLRKNISSRLKRMKCQRVPWSIRFLRESVIAFACVAMVGCASKPVRTTERPTLPIAKSTIGQKLAVAMMPPEASSRAQGNAVAPVYTSTISLEWDNPNPNSAEYPLKYCLTEFHATSDPTKQFTFKAYAPPLTNRVTFAKTNAQEFYICRFVWTNVTPWFATGWNTK